MKTYVKRSPGFIRLLEKDTDIELISISKHDSNQSYKIVDYRYTDELTCPNAYLSDVAQLETIRFDKYQENKLLFDFPIEKRTTKTGHQLALWHSMNGVLLKDADRVDLEFDFHTECYVWSYRGAMKKLKECREFWNSFDDINKIKKMNDSYRFDSYQLD